MVRRIYAEKKREYAAAANSLYEDLKGYLKLSNLSGVRILIRYDIEDIPDDVYDVAKRCVFYEPPVDDLYEEDFPKESGDRVFSVEYLPGQFDQRADSAVQCVQFLRADASPTIRTATTYCLSGTITDEEFEEVKSYCINPVDSRESDGAKPDTLISKYDDPEDIRTIEGFRTMSDDEFEKLYASLGLAMTYRDLCHIRKYFTEEEDRDPSMTEIRVLDTYWSDHCRHTTFSTELTDVRFEDGKYAPVIKATFEEYQKAREEVYAGRNDKFICLMDIALMGMKLLKKHGKLNDQEESDEINACSIVVPIEVDGKVEEWLVSFKNETHNHPTEIEPFGGAATCLGGAIRDPLSGRSYVYQAMRVTGAADPTRPLSETLPGKLPQRKIVRSAASGYSSYGNQIGLATGYVKEIYHPDYVAKRMEIGAVMGAAKRSNVVRLTSDPGDVIILLGGRTGRDGCGGATGSSKAHTASSIETCGAEVQKGNAPTERKLQRLFRRPEVSKLIRKCNDFGAGGVSVAIGELADGLMIDLDKVPKKYAGLDGTELAISESQERMAVVIAPGDIDEFLRYAAEENLEAVEVATVTSKPRLVMTWRGQTIVNLKRAFLDTNGAHQETSVFVEMPKGEQPFDTPLIEKVKNDVSSGDFSSAVIDSLSDLNVCSQKGLVEMFDSTIGSWTVTMPYGGQDQLTETQVMIAKLPVYEGKCDAVTMMSYGFDPYISSWSPYHGAMYAVTESVARIVSAGGDPSTIRFTFQEYFRRMSEDPARWSQPFSALLGAFAAQMGFGLPSIGGKDSMSGTFNDIDVPPTLVSFAVDVSSAEDVVTPEMKTAGNKLVLIDIASDDKKVVDFKDAMTQYERFHQDVKKKLIKAAYAPDGYGIMPALCKMSFGNGLGFKVEHSFDIRRLFTPAFGCIVAEVSGSDVGKLSTRYTLIGEVTDDGMISYGDSKVSTGDAISAWKKPLEDVFPTKSSKDTTPLDARIFECNRNGKSVYVCRNKVARPTVFIPVFPGTNCEYDSARAFTDAGADVITQVFANRNADDIRQSVELFRKGINKAQMIMFPGGFSAGDEPDGSAKFFATAFRNEALYEAVMDLIGNRDGLALGICNGFQALVKLGLLPGGRITDQTSDSPTLTYNTINRHISKMAYTRVVSDLSPWLAGAKAGDTYVIPVSHGEGRFVAKPEVIEKLFANGQVATRYCDPDGNISMDEEYNINGSFAAIEGITSPDGRVFGKMGHSERRGDHVAINITGCQDMKIFESGVGYFR